MVYLTWTAAGRVTVVNFFFRLFGTRQLPVIDDIIPLKARQREPTEIMG